MRKYKFGSEQTEPNEVKKLLNKKKPIEYRLYIEIIILCPTKQT